jgi:hypothetical protein
MRVLYLRVDGQRWPRHRHKRPHLFHMSVRANDTHAAAHAPPYTTTHAQTR